LEGEYHEGPVADLLPVKCKDSDDRVNWCQGVVPKVVSEHASIKELPLDKPPVFCGFNETGLREGAEPVLSACLLEIRGGSLAYTGREYPLLVFGKSGKGTTCALTTDLAPHWVGGWVDWGPERVAAQARGGETVEVGNWYAKFITQLVSFLREA
ncbi:MAG: glutamine amidotransferase, partial [Gemmatimonadota bacterium]|nr:glutamine amidotransferase [Gemmatimonadota bacterium]